MSKQIDEMAEALRYAVNEKHGYISMRGLAEALCNAGFRKQNKWIPVTERLPEKGEEVLVYRGGFIGNMMNTYTYHGENKWEDDYGYYGTKEAEGIIHWMPLPEPPKNEKDTVQKCAYRIYVDNEMGVHHIITGGICAMVDENGNPLIYYSNEKDGAE